MTGELEEWVLTFPDGELVGEGDLQRWLNTIDAQEDLEDSQKEFARDIVQQIRALSN